MLLLWRGYLRSVQLNFQSILFSPNGMYMISISMLFVLLVVVQLIELEDERSSENAMKQIL